MVSQDEVLPVRDDEGPRLVAEFIAWFVSVLMYDNTTTPPSLARFDTFRTRQLRLRLITSFKGLVLGSDGLARFAKLVVREKD